MVQLAVLQRLEAPAGVNGFQFLMVQLAVNYHVSKQSHFIFQFLMVQLAVIIRLNTKLQNGISIPYGSISSCVRQNNNVVGILISIPYGSISS